MPIQPNIPVAVLVLLAVLPGSASADLADEVRRRWSSSAHAPARIDLPADLPAAFSVTVERGGRPVTLDLVRRDLRAPFFRLRAWADGVTRVVDPPPVATYQGVVRGEPASTAGGSLGRDGLSLRVFPAGGASWAVRPLASVEPGADRSAHLVIEGGEWPEGSTCGVEGKVEGKGKERAEGAEVRAKVRSGDGVSAEEASHAPQSAGARSLGAGPWRPRSARVRGASAPPGAGPPGSAWCGPAGLKLTQIAFDVDQVYYRDHGSDIAATTANVEGLLAEVDAYYARDARITYQLTDLIVRTTDFYLPQPTTGSLLDLFRQEWNTNQTGVVRDIAHLMTGQPAPGLAGLAYVGVVCNLPWCYGWSVDSAGVLGHEVGHNWNAGHCHDRSPCNNMCGACLYIAPNTKDIIASFRDGRACLDDVPPFATQVPPYAHPDRLALTRDQAVDRTAVPIDVLANDHDANCDDLAIAAFDATSTRGAIVSRDPGGGPGGRDRLLYAPPCMPWAGDDGFAYTLADGLGGTAAGAVTVDLLDPGLAALWTFDDASGAVAADATGWARDGALANAPAWTSGRRGGALELNGVDQHVTVPPLDLPGLPVTIAGWVRRNGPLASFAAIAFSRGAGTTAGIHVGNTGDLRYTWADDPATYNRSSGLVLPDGQWAFVALVVEAGRATLWLDDGGSWRWWENPIAHQPQGFAADTLLGWDPTSAARHFSGALDDLRVYDAALSEAELLAVRDGGDRAEAPRPADGGFSTDPDQQLSWRGAGAATDRDIYFGRDFAAVRAATPASPEYQGRGTATSFDPPGLLSEGFTYAWRVDEVVGGTPVRGDTWLFTFRGRAPRALHYWRLDEGSGTASADAVGGAAAELRNGAQWASGPYGGAVGFDGVDDIVAAPLPGTTLAEATFTAWVRSNGTPAPWAGLVFTRGGAATGLGLRDAAELGYHWGDSYWWWSSGLTLPLDTWVFVALAIAPDGATLYLHDGSAWTSAVNAAGHGPVPWTGELLLGRDPWGTPRSFAGTLDDVRIYDRALTRAEVEAVEAEPRRALNPMPFDGAALVAPPATLAWVGGADAVTHELYVGDDLTAVRAATTASPEFRGSLTVASWTPPAGLIASGRTWYWRVDERSPAGVATGLVWRFLLPGEVANGLLAAKGPGREPVLHWPWLEGSESFTVERCVPTGPGGCLPAPVATVGGQSRSWPDPAASEPVVWYQVSASPCRP